MVACVGCELCEFCGFWETKSIDSFSSGATFMGCAIKNCVAFINFLFILCFGVKQINLFVY